MLSVRIYDSNEALGAAAADDLANILRAAVRERGEATIILATGNSQRTIFAALCEMPDVPWDRVDVFHMDEYLGLSEDHPASFRRYLREKLIDHIRPRAFHGIRGDAPNPEKEMARYEALLRERSITACVLGIGENGHLAFNDPPADFRAERTIALVTLDETSRRQQVGEGHFPSIDSVPTRAITLTIPALLAPPHVLAIVPEARKALPVQRTLEGPLTPDCPASILRTVPHATLYLDRASAALLMGSARHDRG
jgi:glucosamine-6-phosphate deaminase